MERLEDEIDCSIQGEWMCTKKREVASTMAISIERWTGSSDCTWNCFLEDSVSMTMTKCWCPHSWFSHRRLRFLMLEYKHLYLVTINVLTHSGPALGASYMHQEYFLLTAGVQVHMWCALKPSVYRTISLNMNFGIGTLY